MYIKSLFISIFLTITYVKSFQPLTVFQKDHSNEPSLLQPHWLIHCSGGSDSMSLLYQFGDLLKNSNSLIFPKNVTVVYFDHKQRDRNICKNESDTVKHLSNDQLNFNFVHYPLPDDIYKVIQKRKSINTDLSSQNILRNWRYHASLLLLNDILKNKHLKAINYKFYASFSTLKLEYEYKKLIQATKPNEQSYYFNKFTQSLTEDSLIDNSGFISSLGNYDGIILTGHHKDDQLETILLKLIRGVNFLNLRGMKKITQFPKNPNYCLFRPFLEKSKKQLRETLKNHNISWHEDKSNQDTRYLRNEIRSKLIPLLSNLTAKKVNHQSYINDSFSNSDKNEESSNSLGLRLMQERFDALTSQTSSIADWINSECMKWESEHKSPTSTSFYNLSHWRSIKHEFKRKEILHRWIYMRTKENINYNKLKNLSEKLMKQNFLEWNWRLSKYFNLNYRKGALTLENLSLK